MYVVPRKHSFEIFFGNSEAPSLLLVEVNRGQYGICHQNRPSKSLQGNINTGFATIMLMLDEPPFVCLC